MSTPKDGEGTWEPCTFAEWVDYPGWTRVTFPPAADSYDKDHDAEVEREIWVEREKVSVRA